MIRTFAVISVFFVSVSSITAAHADPDVEPGGQSPLNPVIAVEGITEIGGNGENSEVSSTDAGPELLWEYEWLPACFANYPGQPESVCPNAYNCAEPRALQWTLWARQTRDEQGQPTPDATWQPVLTECRLTDPPATVTPRPQVTDALVLTEVRRLGLPRLTVEVQPDEATLVNFETIFYAEPLPWQRTVDLLGYTVDVQAEPTAYVWEFGDGQSLSTQNPGAPYPEKLVTHNYTDAGMSVTPRVDTAYAIRYRVDGGAWQSMSETVPAAGLPVDLRIREATAVLVGD